MKRKAIFLLSTGLMLLLSSVGAQMLPHLTELQEKLRAAQESLAQWKLESAEAILRNVLTSAPDNPDALTCLGHLSGLRLDYGDAFEALQRALKSRQDDPTILAYLTWLFSKAEVPTKAQGYYRRLKDSVESPERALLHLAETPAALDDFAESDQIINDLVEKGNRRPATLIALARIRARAGEDESSEELIREALALDPNHVPALALLCSLRARKGDAVAARRLCRKTLSLDPWDVETRQTLCNLGIESPANVPPRTDQENAQLCKVRELLSDGSRQEAYALLLPLVESTPGSFDAVLLYGGLCLSLAKIPEAVRLGRRAVESHPEDLLAHLLLWQGLVAKHHAERVRIGGVDWMRRYSLQSPGSVRIVKRLFPDYATLMPLERRVIDNATYPARCLLRKMVASGSRHRILRLDQRITDLKEYERLERSTTFDQRPWACVRGASGRLTASGVETLWEAARFGFSAVAHEVGHQIYAYGLTLGQRTQVRDLYGKAIAEERMLDEYSKASPSEYFAQSYEAFVSHFKRGGLAPPMRHTRNDLKEKDYPMFALLYRITSGN